MPRLLAASIVWVALVAGCVLGDPAGDALIVQGQVRNNRPRPVQLEVRVADGVLAGAVQPALIPAGRSLTVVTYRLPVGVDWWIAVDGDAYIAKSDFGRQLQPGCSLDIVLEPDGSSVHGCSVR